MTNKIDLMGSYRWKSAALVAVILLPSVVPSAASAQELPKLPPPKYGNVPLLFSKLRIHTCDVPDAGTNDQVRVLVQTKSNAVTFSLNNPGDDFRRNGWDEYRFANLGTGADMQLKDIRKFTIQKPGSDKLCIDKLELRGPDDSMFWSYDADDAKAGPTAPPQNKSNGKIYIDGDKSDAPGNNAPFSDVEVTYNDPSDFGAMTIAIHTCASENADTNGRVELKVIRDGAAEPGRINLGAVGRTRDKWDYVRIYDGSISSKATMRLYLKGTNGWCVDNFAIRHGNGSWQYGGKGRSWLDSTEANGWSSKLVAENLVTVSGSIRRPLGRSWMRDVKSSWDAWMSAYPDGNWGICQLPEKIQDEHLEDILKVEIAEVMDKNSDVYWGDRGSVNLTRKSARSWNTRIKMRGDIPGLLFDRDVDVTFSITAKCDKDGFRFETSKPDVDVNANVTWFDFLLFGIPGATGLFFGDTINDFAADKIPDLPTPKLSGINYCPSMSIDSSNDLVLNWDSAVDRLVNAELAKSDLTTIEQSIVKSMVPKFVKNMMCRVDMPDVQEQLRGLLNKI